MRREEQSFGDSSAGELGTGFSVAVARAWELATIDEVEHWLHRLAGR